MPSNKTRTGESDACCCLRCGQPGGQAGGGGRFAHLLAGRALAASVASVAEDEDVAVQEAGHWLEEGQPAPKVRVVRSSGCQSKEFTWRAALPAGLLSQPRPPPSQHSLHTQEHN